MKKNAKCFEDLLVWQKAHKFVLAVYKETAQFPGTERYGLTSQFRRSAVSIPANIAEGFKRTGKLDKIRFMNIAQSSLEECRYYIRLSYDLGYSNNSDLLPGLEEVSKMLDSYTRAIDDSRK